MAAIVIFVEGADTEPDPLPVYFLNNQDHATLICEGLKESDYRNFNFAMKDCTRSNRGKFDVWLKMAIDARDGVYGSIAAGIYNRIDEAHAIISQRRVHQGPVAPPNRNVQNNGGSVLSSSKQEKPTETVDNLDAALARKQLRPYVKIPEFRQYVKEQITQWELWHRSHTEEINEHEGLRDKFHQELKELQGRDLRHSDDPEDFDQLGSAEHCYEFHRDLAAWLKDDPEYKLVADREPVLFKEASVAAIVALFWCDVNDSTWLVPEYDFLEPEGPFIEYLREQWQNPIQARYKYIHWFVEAAISAYLTRASDDAGQSEENELLAAAGISLDGLTDEAESKAAMDLCRQIIVGDAASTHKPDIDAGGDVPPPSSTAVEGGKEAIDEQDSADSEHSAGDGKQDSTGKKRQIRLANWAIAFEDGKTFRLFHRQGKEADWRESGKVDVPEGLQRAVLLVLADNDGAMTKVEAIKAVQENRNGMSNTKIMKSVVTPALTKLRSTIKAAIARVAKTTLESGEIGNPLPYCESSKSWRSDISIGFAELNNDGDRLRFVTKSQRTAEREATRQGYLK